MDAEYQFSRVYAKKLNYKTPHAVFFAEQEQEVA